MTLPSRIVQLLKRGGLHLEEVDAALLPALDCHANAVLADFSDQQAEAVRDLAGRDDLALHALEVLRALLRLIVSSSMLLPRRR